MPNFQHRLTYAGTKLVTHPVCVNTVKRTAPSVTSDAEICHREAKQHAPSVHHSQPRYNASVFKNIITTIEELDFRKAGVSAGSSVKK